VIRKVRLNEPEGCEPPVEPELAHAAPRHRLATSLIGSRTLARQFRPAVSVTFYLA
jgi:hypothetical protein